jgi:hypothetical protein
MTAQDRHGVERFARTLAEAEPVKTGRAVEARLRTLMPAEPIEATWSAPEKGNGV